jgi:hypothetical protein
MLVEFRLKNYGVFRDEQVLRLTASGDDTLIENTFRPGKASGLRLLKSAVIYGANASGKSTFLDAMAFGRHLVLRSAKFEPEESVGVNAFALDTKSGSRPTTIEYTFIHDRVRYQYGFEVNRKRILEEWLISYPRGRPRSLFVRKADSGGSSEYSFSTFLKGEKEKIKELTRPNALFLSVGATFNNVQLKHIYKWFAESLSGVQAGRLRDESLWRRVSLRRLKDEARSELMKNLLKYADLGIVDFAVKEGESILPELPEKASKAVVEAYEKVSEVLRELRPEMPKAADIFMYHSTGDKKIEFPFRMESDGTQQLFYLGGPIIDALVGGDVLFVDEIDSSLHPRLVEAVVELFHNPSTNPDNAQLIFNTHATSLLYMPLFRRDQVWFVEKNEEGASKLYSLLDYRPRKEEAIGKGYLLGRYGGVPVIGDLPKGV